MPKAPALRTIGWRETVDLPDLGLGQLVAKIDTGARTSALHATRKTFFSRDGQDWVRFHVPHAGLNPALECEAPIVDRRGIKNTSGQSEDRVIIESMLGLGGRSWRIELSLADRQSMSFPLILGRTALRGHRLLINPGRSFLVSPAQGELP